MMPRFYRPLLLAALSACAVISPTLAQSPPERGVLPTTLQNPTFEGDLSLWTVTDAIYSGNDHTGTKGSGSAALIANDGEQVGGLHQVIAIDGGEYLSVTGFLWLDEFLPANSGGAFFQACVGTNECVAPFIRECALSDFRTEDGDFWTPHRALVHAEPTDTCLLVSIDLLNNNGTAVGSNADDFAVELAIFFDGFESGDTTGW